MPHHSYYHGLALTADRTNGIKLFPWNSKRKFDNQMWRIETQPNGASQIISNGKKKLCGVYQNETKIKLLSNEMKLKEPMKLTLEDTVKDGIDLWLLSAIN